MDNINYLKKFYTNIELFNSAEEAWFWYVRCQRSRDEGVRINRNEFMIRPCTIDDIHNIVLSLYLAGKLKKIHIEILTEYGMKFMTPKYINDGEGNQDYNLWVEAFDIIKPVLVKKEIVKKLS